MGASFSSCFCIAKAVESPCTENDRVAELEGAEGAASSGRMQYSAKAEESPSTAVDVVAGFISGSETSGRSEYYSERCEAMMRSRGQSTDAVALEIEFSKSHWSEVSRLEVAPQSADEERLNRENREVCKQMAKEYPNLFATDLAHHFSLGRMVAKGGQAEIYEVAGNPYRLMKVFKRGTSLRDLRQSWPLPVLEDEVHQCIWVAGMLQDGRFAFVMKRFWGDLRKLIDQAMLEKNVDGIQHPPFPYNGREEAKGWNFYPIDFIGGIAMHMSCLHEKGVSHRDLKASNILLPNDLKAVPDISYWGLIIIGDFECSIGVLGTGYWRAPEILAALGKHETFTNEQWKKADVYSFGMTCFEIVTGRIPFDGELENTKVHRQLVIEGKRPQLPSDLDDGVKDLITKCWAHNPSLRPTFSQLVEMAKTISTKQCEFRLFGIGDELPPQYCLATLQEVQKYTTALSKAMPTWESANLANGFVKGRLRGLNTRLEKQSNASFKLARRHHD